MSPERRAEIALQIAESIVTKLIPQVYESEGVPYDIPESLEIAWMIVDLVGYLSASYALHEQLDGRAIRAEALDHAKDVMRRIEREMATTGSA